MPTLVLCPTYNDNNQTLWKAAIDRGWDVERLMTYHVPEELKSVEEPVLYIQALFAPTIARDFGISLKEPPNDWMPNLSYNLRQRNIYLMTLGEARKITIPRFVKPPNDKSFKASVCLGRDLPLGDDQEPVLVADPVKWLREFRCFVLDGKIQTTSRYFQAGELLFTPPSDEEMEKIEGVVSKLDLPSKAIVVDVGEIEGRGWAVVELNAAWGSGIYRCNPHAVLDVMRAAMLPLHPI